MGTAARGARAAPACAARGGAMIRFILLQNKQGKTRLSKYYVPLEDTEKRKLEQEIHREYAGLFFSLCVDIHDNELAHLEAIHLLVEVLDHFFSGVCELDLVFGFNKVYMIIDEFFMAGEVQETSKRVILERLEELMRQE